MRGKLFINSPVILTYIAFILLSYLTFAVGYLNFDFFDSTSFFRLVKFTLFILFLTLPYYIYREYSFKDLVKITKYQVLFILLSGLYVIYHMVFQPQSITDYAWGYDNRYRLIGLTSYVIDLSGELKKGGSTSVSMGVFVAFIFFIFLSLYKHYKKISYLAVAIILFLFEFLTYSRAGILVLITGIGYFFLLNLSPSVVFKSVMLVIIFTIVGIWFNFFDQLSTFGTLAKITDFSLQKDASISTRVDMLMAGYHYILANPETLIWGSGYGEEYTMMAIGHSHLEGVFPTTLFTSGLFAVGLLIFHFYFAWDLSKRYSIGINSPFTPFLYALRLFIPGWFLSAVTAGNTFQTDYYFPFIYFMLFVPYFKIRNLKENIQ
jgi:hypothetical protein